MCQAAHTRRPDRAGPTAALVRRDESPWSHSDPKADTNLENEPHRERQSDLLDQLGHQEESRNDWQARHRKDPLVANLETRGADSNRPIWPSHRRHSDSAVRAVPSGERSSATGALPARSMTRARGIERSGARAPLPGGLIAVIHRRALESRTDSDPGRRSRHRADRGRRRRGRVMRSGSGPRLRGQCAATWARY